MERSYLKLGNNPDTCFFDTTGLTTTSANHIANMAKELYVAIEQELKEASLTTTKVTLIGESSSHIISAGVNSHWLSTLKEKAERITKLKSLIAWLREAINAKELLIKAIDFDEETWAAENNIELLCRPEQQEHTTVESLIKDLPVKERNQYFVLETKCAVLGKLIHPEGTFAEQRKQYNYYQNNPTKIEGNGRDTLIYTRSSSITPQEIEDTFFELQKLHRESQASLNAIKHNLEERVKQLNLEQDLADEKAFKEYHAQQREINIARGMYIREETKKISSLKIVIPNNLQDIYQEVTNLGKQK